MYKGPLLKVDGGQKLVLGQTVCLTILFLVAQNLIAAIHRIYVRSSTIHKTSLSATHSTSTSQDVSLDSVTHKTIKLI